MKALIEIKGGDWSGCKATAYVNHKYADKDQPNSIDCKMMVADGYDFVLIRNGTSNLDLKLATAPEYESDSFIWVHIQNPRKIFDLSKIESNVRVDVTRTHSIFGWFVYCTFLASYKLKKLMKS